MNINVIKTGGKQYKVAKGDVITVEKIADAKKGDIVSFDQVLLASDGSKTTIGAPVIDKAVVKGEVIDAGRAAKITVIKYKAKSRYFKNRGHRQPFTKVKITELA
jgi:large subunit ribosomal protein L21